MIDKRIIETVLSDQKEELERKQKQLQKFCLRQEERLIDLDSPQAQVIIGVRRSGKSTLCHQVLHHANVKFAYINFDDEQLIGIGGEDLNNVQEVLYKIYGDFKYLFIDEIQNINEWYLFVNRLLRRGLHILITGSNAKLLSGELATHLTGRHHAITLYPLSFCEYCTCKQIDTASQSTLAIAKRRAAFDEYMQQGGFPELLSIKNARDYIDDLVGNILQRDIEQRFKIQYKAAFEQMAQHLLNVSPTVVVDTALQDLFRFKSEHTAKNYVSYLKQAYLLLGIQKYSAKSRLRMTSEKVYPVDIALMNKRSDAFVGENLGWRLETVVYIELLRRCKHSGLDVYYYRDRSGECDFIVCEGNKAVQAIQVSYDIQNAKTRKREIAGLLLAARKTGCTNLLLLTDHEDETIETENQQITVRPVFDWCLKEFA